MIKVLIVEDDQSISNFIDISLIRAGYSTSLAFDWENAIELVDRHEYDLILLDIMIPKLDGFAVLEYVKELNIPVIFITALSDINNKVNGLKLGADDYITKPFDIEELLVRVEVILRRNHKIGDIIRYRDLEINIDSHIVKKNGIDIDLTAKEFAVLLLFMRNKNVALYRSFIYERIWKDDFYDDTRTVDLHIARIKKRLDLEKEIKTVYKIGYRFEEQIWNWVLRYL